MNKIIKLSIAILCLAFALGCSQIADIPKVIWGSSTRALEEARADAISKTYKCGFDDCFDAVLSLARNTEDEEKIEEDESSLVITKPKYFNVFIKDRKKRHIVIMGIQGSIATTEVGIFFTQPSLTTVQLEVTSLSSNAKRKAAQIIFDELDSRFSEIQ